MPWTFLTLATLLVVFLIAIQGLTSHSSDDLARRIHTQVTTPGGAKAMYLAHPGLRAGYGSEAAFQAHIAAWLEAFGTFPAQPVSARKILPFTANVEIQGSGGAWMGIYARQGPFACLHGIAFAATAEEARRACQDQLIKRYQSKAETAGQGSSH